MNVPGEGERDAARHGAVPRAGPVREQQLERLRRRPTERRVHVLGLRVVELPAARVVDAEQREARALTLDHVAAVLHEHLPRVPAATDHRLLAGVAVVVAEHRHDAEGRMEVAEGVHVGRDVRGRDVDHIARLHDEVGPERVRQRHDLLHPVFLEMDAGVQVGEVEHGEAVEACG